MHWNGRSLRTGAMFVLILTSLLVASGHCAAEATPEQRARAFIQVYEKTVRPLEKEAGLAWWQANITGKDEDFARKRETEDRLNLILADSKRFAELKAIKDSPIDDPMLRRQIDVLYLMYLAKQVDPALLQRMTEKANTIEREFNVYRARVGGEELTDSQSADRLEGFVAAASGTAQAVRCIRSK